MTVDMRTPRGVAGAFLDQQPGGGGPAISVPPAEHPGHDPVFLWASQRITNLVPPEEPLWPEYGSPEWRALHPDSPHRLAAAVEAAELWRNRDEPNGPPEEEYVPVSLRLDRQAARIVYRLRHPHRPAHEVAATDGWPPVAIPGRPGWSRHLVNGEQRDRENGATGA